MSADPLYYVRGGYISHSGNNYGDLWNSGYSGFYYSSTVWASSGAIGAYYLPFSSNEIGQQYNYDRYYGRSVRCVIR